MNGNELMDAFRDAGQEQVFRFWDELDESARQRLLDQAREIDLDEIATLTRTLLAASGGAKTDLSNLEPAPYIAVPEHGGNEVDWTEAKLAGEKALAAGKVAAFTVAGGQGTRLGFDGPKGTYPVTPVRRNPLFQVFAEKIRAAENRYSCRIPWLIMTSHVNHDATVSFFEKNSFFGLQADQIHFFRQGRMPAVDPNGKILLESRDTIAMSPDGHGGSLRALLRSGALDAVEKEGIEVISYFQVDNPLVHGIDPHFIGFHVLRGSEMSSKMVPKAYPKEKVGHFCIQNGKLVVIEYSDLPDELAEKREADGSLTYLSGSIAIHLLSTSFVRRVGSGSSGLVLPFHRADKKIKTVDADGNRIVPDKPNGVKFEMFVFDAIPFAKDPIVIETRRADEFSPVKNAEGVDSPETCRNDQLRQFTRWLLEAGVPVPCDETGLPGVVFEISPLFGYDQDSFESSWAKLNPKPGIEDGLILE